MYKDKTFRKRGQQQVISDEAEAEEGTCRAKWKKKPRRWGPTFPFSKRTWFPLFVIFPPSTISPNSFDSLAKFPQLRLEAVRTEGKTGSSGPR